MNLFENLQMMTENDHEYNGQSYWNRKDMLNLYSMFANKVNNIPFDDRIKLQTKFKKYNHSVSFMPKYTLGLKSNPYPTNIYDLIKDKYEALLLDEDEIWDIIEDLISLNKYLDTVNIDELKNLNSPSKPSIDIDKRRNDLLNEYIKKYPKLQDLLNKYSFEIISTPIQCTRGTLSLYNDDVKRTYVLFNTGYLRVYRNKDVNSSPTNILKEINIDFIEKSIEKYKKYIKESNFINGEDDEYICTTQEFEDFVEQIPEVDEVVSPPFAPYDSGKMFIYINNDDSVNKVIQIIKNKYPDITLDYCDNATLCVEFDYFETDNDVIPVIYK